MRSKALTICRERVEEITSKQIGRWESKWWDENSCPACVCKDDTVQGETPPPDDKFIAQEVALAALLLLAWEAALAQFNVLARLMEAAQHNQLSYVDTTAQDIGNEMQRAYDDAKISAQVVETLNTTFSRGLEVAGAGSALAVLLLSRNRYNASIEQQIKYTTNAYFSRIVHPTIMDELRAHVQAIDGEESFPKIMQGLLDQGLFKTEPYWRLVANQDISRSHHYGVLRGMEERGYTIYEFVAVVDSRTTKVCLAMNGTQFRVADGINHLENTASAVTPEEVKSVSPWVTAADIKGKSSAELVSMGCLTPPLHPNCRSTLRAIS